MSNQNLQKPMTIDEFAQTIGVSRSQISTAFSGKGRISPKTRERVLTLAHELGFQPNPHARRLAHGGCHDTIGVFTVGMDLGIGTQKITLIQHRLSERGYNVPLHSSAMRPQDEAEKQAAEVRTICQLQMTAIICVADHLEQQSLEELRRFISRGQILCCLGEADLPCDQIIFDEEDYLYQAAKHLIELGHKNIGYGEHGPFSEQRARFQGFRRALREAGLKEVPDWHFGGFEVYEDAGAAIAAKFLKLNQRPSAICIVNDVSAATFVNCLLRNNIRVPDEVSVVGTDDIAAARHCIVPLTTVSHPVNAIVDIVVETITSRIEKRYDGPPRKIVVQGELIKRQSTRALI